MILDREIIILGGTGRVGMELLEILHDRGYSLDKVKCYASDKSEGRSIAFGDSKTIKTMGMSRFRCSKEDIVISSLSERVSSDILKNVVGKCKVVIDLSSAHRKDKKVPVIIPNVNGGTISGDEKLISGPNCVVSQIASFLYPISDAFGIKNVSISTYQAVSGAGNNAMKELFSQTKSIFEGNVEHETREFDREISFNCIPAIGSFNKEGFTLEEEKIGLELNKILDKKIDPIITCVRVPVFNCHAAAVSFDLIKNQNSSVQDVVSVIKKSRDNDIMFAPQDMYVTQKQFSKQNGVIVSRFRKNSKTNTFAAWVVSDNLRKGAALNAIDILDIVIKKLK